jgi:alkylated DNA repair protein (DNA oxidative demethylase)
MVLRRGFAGVERQKTLLAALKRVLEAAPARPNRTKGGQTSAAMTNCGPLGWVSDPKGYRYTPENPATGRPWPGIPPKFRELVAEVMAATPWPGFIPDACLINFYGPGAKMGLHQDKDERDFTQPIVTVSLGDTADFLIGGFKRADTPLVLKLTAGDILVMGGESRMRFHGVRKVYPGTSDLGGRYSLTFRKAG